MIDYLHELLYSAYPYICSTVLLLGSLTRFDREQYTWKNDTSQVLRRGTLRVGNSLFHWGILVAAVGHFVGFLALHWVVSFPLSTSEYQLLVMMGGGAVGIVSIIGLTVLIHQRLSDTRVWHSGRTWDIVIVLISWVWLVPGFGAAVLSIRHMGDMLLEVLTSYVKGVVIFRPGIARLLDGMPLTYQLYILLGFAIFLMMPLAQMVHIWNGFASLAYLTRPYQLVHRR